jgi:hypothetical protein
MSVTKSTKSQNQLIPTILTFALLGAGTGYAFAPKYLLPFTLGGAGAGTTLSFTLRPRRRQLDGRHEVSSAQLNRHLHPKRSNTQPSFSIGNVCLGEDHESRNIFCIGRPGAGKSQAIAQLLAQAKQRSDIRLIIIDRGGEALKQFYDPNTDLIFNPYDRRSIAWSHHHEMQSVSVEAIAASLVPIIKEEERFWYVAAQTLLSSIWENTTTNSEIAQVLCNSPQAIHTLVNGTPAAQYFGDPKTATNILATLNSVVGKPYKVLHDEGQPFSFFDYARSDRPGWLFMPLMEGQDEVLKPFASMAIDLIIRGILSQDPNPKLKTLIVMDELGALQKLPNLHRLLSEGRKFGGSALIGTQTDAQVSAIYGSEATRMLLQNTFTKLILGCPDPETSRKMADLIGQQRFKEPKVSTTRDRRSGQASETISWELREQYVIQLSQIQTLPDLEGYLLFADDSPVAKIRLSPQNYPQVAEAFLPTAFRTQPLRPFFNPNADLGL